MAKILITSIGSGGLVKTGKIEYSKAKYYFNDRDFIEETPYIFDAIRCFKEVDKCIFVGTCGSNWYLLYEYLHEFGKLKKDYDINYSLEMADFYEEATRTNLDIPDFSSRLLPLKEAMGDFCAEIVILKYGVNDEEILENFQLLLTCAERFIKEGDSIIFDITHSFRSLAFYELLAVNYLKTKKRGKVNIDFVSYGMLEYSRGNNGLTPIVDLSLLVNAMDWTKAAEEYNRFGTAYLLGDLLKEKKLGFELSQEDEKALQLLGNTITGNDLKGFKSLIRYCISITNDKTKQAGAAYVVLGYIFEDLAKNFRDGLNDNILLYTELAKRHFKYKRYLTCAIILMEGLFDYFAALLGEKKVRDIKKLNAKRWKMEEQPFRKKILRAESRDSLINQFLTNLRQMNDIRNYLAHAGSLNIAVSKMNWPSYWGIETQNTVEEELEKFSKYFHTAIRSQFRNKPDNENALRDVIRDAVKENENMVSGSEANSESFAMVTFEQPPNYYLIKNKNQCEEMYLYGRKNENLSYRDTFSTERQIRGGQL